MRLLRAQLTALEDGRPAIDRVKGSPQLVREGGEELILGAIGGFGGFPCGLGRQIDARIVARHRHLTDHRFREQEIRSVIAAVGFRDRERDRPEGALAYDHWHDHPGPDPKLLKELELLGILRGLLEVGRGGRGDERGPARGEDGGDAARGRRAEAVAGPGFVRHTLFGRIDMGAGSATERALRILDIDGA